MAQLGLSEFLHDRNLLAIKIASRDLGGFFRKAITIPLNTAGLAIFPDGRSALFPEGREVSGTFDLVLVKTGDIHIRAAFPDLRTSDGFPLSAGCAVSVSITATRADLIRDFCRVLFTLPGTYGMSDLKCHVLPELRRILSEHAATRAVAELHRADSAGAVGPVLHAALERHLFDAGVRYGKLLEISMISAEFEKRAASEVKRVEDDRRSAQVMDRKEERLRRLAGILKDQEVQGLLARVPDEKLRGLLYAKLMEDDAVQITAQELVSKAKDCGEEVVQVIYRAMENLLSTGASVGTDEVETATSDRIFVATGNNVLEIAPADASHPRMHAFPDSLRSVRHAETARGALLVGGTKRGVTTLALDGGETLDFPLPKGLPVRGGVNSIAVAGDLLYATHSEHGLARWRLDRPGEPAEILFEEITRPHRTTRAVQAVDGRVLFSTGAHVYLAPADAGAAPVKFVSSIESPVSCVAAAARTIFAGTESGAIVCWKIDAPDQPVVLVRKREAIVNVRLAKICAIPHLIYSTRDLAVRARVIGQNLETSYESGGARVGLLDAASDFICAADGDGRRVLLWKSTEPSHPAAQIDVWRRSDKPVLDVWMKKIRARSA